AAARDALAGRQRRAAFHVVHQKVESVLRMRLDQLELRIKLLVSLDMVAVLDFVEAVGGSPVVAIAVIVMALVLRGGCDLACVRARVVIDRQQRVPGARQRDQRTPTLPGAGDSGDLRPAAGVRTPAQVAIGASAAPLRLAAGT